MYRGVGQISVDFAEEKLIGFTPWVCWKKRLSLRKLRVLGASVVNFGAKKRLTAETPRSQTRRRVLSPPDPVGVACL